MLEAMACGTPVIAANLSSLPEVVGDAGILVDPYNTEELADGMAAIVNDSQLRERLHEHHLPSNITIAEIEQKLMASPQRGGCISAWGATPGKHGTKNARHWSVKA